VPAIRARICDGPGFLGIKLEEKRKAAIEGVISAVTSRVAVRVIRTNEARQIAKTICRVLSLTIEKEHDHKKMSKKNIVVKEKRFEQEHRHKIGGEIFKQLMGHDN